MKLDYRMSLWNYYHYAGIPTLERCVEQCVGAGYGFELWPRWGVEGDMYAPRYRERLRVLLQDVPTSLHCCGAKTIEGQQIQIDTANHIGADAIVVHPGTVRVSGENVDYGFTRDVVQYAKERNVRIALENGPLADLAGAIEAVDDLVICIDTGHIYFTDNTMKEFVDTLKPRLAHLHLQDTLKESDHYFLGSGIIPREDWEYLFAALNEIEFSGPAVFEIRPRTPMMTVPTSIEFVEGLLSD